MFVGVTEEFPLVNVSNIVTLYLSSNRLEGPIPDSFFRFQKLESIDLSKNTFNGSFQLDKIKTLGNLRKFDLSHNNLWVRVRNDNPNAYGLPRLKRALLASCNMYNFPDFRIHSDMRELDLSGNGISGEIPSWIWAPQLLHLDLSSNLLTDLQKPYRIPASLEYINLQSNKFSGELPLLIPLPNITSDLRYLLFANNNVRGSVPAFLCSATKVDILDLSGNKLSGNIPPCLLENIRVFDVGRNNISSHIPDNFSAGCSLQIFDVNNNTLEGKIPRSLESCKQLELMNVGNNIINDTFPCMLPPTLRVLVMKSNRFHGEVRCHAMWPHLQILDISSNNFYASLESFNFSSWKAMAELRPNHAGSEFLYMGQYYKVGVRLTMKGVEMEIVKIWAAFIAIDLSCNSFQGEIPKAIGGLTSLLLNLSQNALNGSIPNSFGKLAELESLDLSRNRLTGSIPGELGGLTFLSFLNVSYNNLGGEIPNGRQLQTFSADSFGGNPGLCGFNLNVSCKRDGDGESSPRDHEKREIEWEYVSVALGYGVGVGIFVWILVFCPTFRYKYFHKIDEVFQNILDCRNRRRRSLARRRAERNRIRRQ